MVWFSTRSTFSTSAQTVTTAPISRVTAQATAIRSLAVVIQCGESWTKCGLRMMEIGGPSGMRTCCLLQEVDVKASDGEIVQMFLEDGAGYDASDATENVLAGIAADAALAAGADQFRVSAFQGGDSHEEDSPHYSGDAVDIDGIGGAFVRGMMATTGGQFQVGMFMLSAAMDSRLGRGAQVIGPLGGVTIGSGGQWIPLNMNAPEYNSSGNYIGTLGSVHAGHIHIGLW